VLNRKDLSIRFIISKTYLPVLLDQVCRRRKTWGWIRL